MGAARYLFSGTARPANQAKQLPQGDALLHVVQPPMVTSDYGLAMENVQEILAVSERAANIATQLGHGTRELYLKVRAAAKPVFYDRPLDEDIRAARRVIL